MVVMPVEMYHNMCTVHLKDDTKVGWRELEESQKEIRAHARAISRMTRLGEAGGNRNKARCFDNLSSWACDPPVLRCVAKTHKDPGPDGTPKSRPIVGASKGLTTSLGEILSDILDPVARTVEDPREAQSTEELMRSIQETNLTLEQQEVKDCLVASMDVEALYPSIN